MIFLLLQVKANKRYAGASNWTVKVSYTVLSPINSAVKCLLSDALISFVLYLVGSC
jgi:hypothetical protein